MTDTILPGAHAALVGPDGRAEKYFYRWLQSINSGVNGGNEASTENATDIRIIATRLGSPDGSVENIPPQGIAAVINGAGSIEVSGTLESGAVNIALFADTQYPGTTWYYGSGPDGKRGWFSIGSAFTDSVSIGMNTDPTTGVSTPALKPTGVEAGTYGDGVKLLLMAVEADGRLTTVSEKALVAGNGISFDIDPDTGAITISVNSFVATNRITRDGNTRVTRNGDIRVTR